MKSFIIVIALCLAAPAFAAAPPPCKLGDSVQFTTPHGWTVEKRVASLTASTSKPKVPILETYDVTIIFGGVDSARLVARVDEAQIPVVEGAQGSNIETVTVELQTGAEIWSEVIDLTPEISKGCRSTWDSGPDRIYLKVVKPIEFN